MPAKDKFDLILCFDVLEHVLDPSQQLLEFYKTFNSEGKMIVNWYLFKGFNQEYPFHLDDPKVVEIFSIHFRVTS
ncbi:methyltransferase domain-containing protein [Nostoc sp.]|uniref:methyltransferase domain-containing protein n=1 Tax=Nostoc sp. TaxID=1180 RepID=UPI002FF4DD6A